MVCWPFYRATRPSRFECSRDAHYLVLHLREPLLPDKHPLDHVRRGMLVEIMPDKPDAQRSPPNIVSTHSPCCSTSVAIHYAHSLPLGRLDVELLLAYIRRISGAVYVDKKLLGSAQHGGGLYVSQRVGLSDLTAPGRGNGVGQEKRVEGEKRRRAPGLQLMHVYLASDFWCYRRGGRRSNQRSYNDVVEGAQKRKVKRLGSTLSGCVYSRIPLCIAETCVYAGPGSMQATIGLRCALRPTASHLVLKDGNMSLPAMPVARSLARPRNNAGI